MTASSGEQRGELLSAYLDGELDAGERGRVESLLRREASAREQLAQLRRTVELVRGLPRHAAPPGLADELQGRLERRELVEGLAEPASVGRPRRTPLYGMLSAAAIIGLLAGGVWYMAPDASRPGSNRESHMAQRQSASPGVDRLEQDKSTSRRLRARRGAVGRSTSSNGDESAAPPAQAEILAAATLDQKLAAGLGIGAVTTHSFDNEPVRLRVTTNDRRSEREIASRLLARLSGGGAVDAGSSIQASAVKDPGRVSLYYFGSAPRNFADAGGSRILVRASASQVHELIQESSLESASVGFVELISGPLHVAGLSASRTALARLAGRQEADGGAGLLQVLAQLLRVDVESTGASTDVETIIGPLDAAVVEAGGPREQRGEKERSSDEATKRGSDEATKRPGDGDGGLRPERVEQENRRAGEQGRAAPAGSRSGEQVSTGGLRPERVEQEIRRAGEKGRPSEAESIITLVIEIGPEDGGTEPGARR